jgi:uncharacterized coiled-coil DUF342 family protein
MKKLELHALHLMSRREKTARTIRFHPKTTVIRGSNDTGKSSVIKSIYWCFGADPAASNKVWDTLDICGAIDFSVDGIGYKIVRHKRQFGLFSTDGQRLATFSGVTRELGPYLSKIFDFGLLMNDREGNPATPPPAYYLLPFYIDQDKGWNETWSSFASLQQFQNWKRDVLEYHIGLLPNKYYQLKTVLRHSNSSLDEPKRQEKSLALAAEQVNSRLSKFSVDFNLDLFQQEIAELIKEAEHLSAQEESYRLKVGELASQRTFLIHQIDIAKRTLGEVNKDYIYAVDLPRQVECPTCGAVYENSIAERFKLALDEDECTRMLNDFQRERAILDEKLETTHRELDTIRKIHTRAWSILDTKRKDVTLHQLILSEARGEAIRAINDQINQVREQINHIGNKIKTAQESLVPFKSRDRTKSFREELNSLLDKFSVALRVSIPKPSRFDLKIRETGSDMPRAILAYQFAVLHMIWQHSTAARTAIVIDSPNQQDQDSENIKAMLIFIRDQLPDDAQLILGLVDPQGIQFDGIEHEFTAKRQVLSSSDYATTGVQLERLLARIYEE